MVRLLVRPHVIEGMLTKTKKYIVIAYTSGKGNAIEKVQFLRGHNDKFIINICKCCISVLILKFLVVT